MCIEAITMMVAGNGNFTHDIIISEEFDFSSQVKKKKKKRRETEK